MEHLTHVLTAIDAEFGRGAGAALPAGAGGAGGKPRGLTEARRAEDGEAADDGLQATRQAPVPEPDPRGDAAAAGLAARRRVPRPPASAGCPTPRTGSRSASPAGSSPRSRRSSAFTSSSRSAIAWLMRAQHGRGADRARSVGNPLTFPLIAWISLASRAADPRARRQRARTSSGCRTPSPGAAIGALGEILSLFGLGESAVGQARAVLPRRHLALPRRRAGARARRGGRRATTWCGRWSPPTRRGGGRGCWRARTAAGRAAIGADAARRAGL